jgi:hydroxymethylbilane synthase
MRRLGPLEIVPIRGNVPTRLRKVDEGAADGVVLAAAGLRRLGLRPAHEIALPVDRFVPPPAQGALAVQTRGDDPAASIVAALEDATTRRAVDAERAFMARVEAGCQTPLGAHARIDEGAIALHAQLFTEDGSRLAEGTERGDDAAAVGTQLADRLLAELQS